MVPSKKIVFWADKLRDISALGQLYSTDFYDKERYQKIQEIVEEMLVYATNMSVTKIEHMKIPYFSRPSPLVGGDAAVIDSEGNILLIQRSDNKKWAMPGGLLEVGETPAEGVIREVLEETGVKSRIVSLIGIFDSRLCGTTFPLHMYHFMFLCKPSDDETIRNPTHKHESLIASWFNKDSLPTDIDPGHVSRISEAFRVWKGDSRAYFDL